MQILKTIAAVLNENDLKTLPHANVGSSSDTVAKVLQLVFGIAGAIALLIITIAALQYVLSQGNPQSTAKAKDTILYAVVGLVICVLAFSIVSFVANSL
jgi:hypothetical protein